MGKVRASQARFYLDRYHISGNTRVGSLTINQPEIDTSSLLGPGALIDNYTTQDEITAFNEYEDDGFDEYIHALVGDEGDHYLARLPTGAAENSLAYDGVVRLSRDPLVIALGSAQMRNLGFSGASGLYRGLVLRAGTITGNGNGTGRNQGATILGQEYAVTYRVLSGTFTSFDLQVQQSTDDGAGDAYSAIAALTQSFSAVGSARKSTTAVTEAWKRITVANWIGTSAVILVTAGLVAG